MRSNLFCKKSGVSLRNEQGLLALDFMFALVLVTTFASILFAITLTLSVVEVTQYMTFAAARSYHGGHISETRQKDLGNAKFLQLRNNPALAPFFKTTWFALGPLQIDDFSQKEPLFAQPPDRDSEIFVGARVRLTANILNIRVPFFGSTTEDDQGLSANVASYLMREPTYEECLSYSLERYNALVARDAAYSIGGGAAGGQFYAPEMLDNGC